MANYDDKLVNGKELNAVTSQIYTDMSNLDIGATNLCVETSNCTGASVYKDDADTGTVTLTVEDAGYRNVKCTTLSLSQSTYKSGIKFTNICKQNPFKKGWYTFSGEYFTSDEVSRWQYLQAAVQTTALEYTVDNVTVPAIDNTDTGEQFTPVIGKWTKFKMSFLIDDGITEMIPTLYCRNDNTSTTLKLACVKIERGNFATDWSASPEDAASSSSSGGSELDTDLSIYVLPSTGSDDTGDGSEASPYATFAKAVSIIPSNLNGHKVIIYTEATEMEGAAITRFIDGIINVQVYGAPHLTASTTTTFTSPVNITDCAHVIFRMGTFIFKDFNNYPVKILRSKVTYSSNISLPQWTAEPSHGGVALTIEDSIVDTVATNNIINIVDYDIPISLRNSTMICNHIVTNNFYYISLDAGSVLKYITFDDNGEPFSSKHVSGDGEVIDLTTKIHQSANNTDYTTYRSRNIGFGTTSTPTVDDTYGGNGAIYFYYT